MEQAATGSFRQILTITVFLTGNVMTGSSSFSAAIAQENSSNTNGTSKTTETDSTPPTARIDQPKGKSDMIDEITVMGSRSLSSLRRDLVEAEDNIYDIFNSLNDDDGYDIICKRETRIGSQIPYRVCKARMFREAAAKSAQEFSDAAQGLSGGAAFGTPVLNEQRHNEILRDKMRALAAKNPQLIEALRKRIALQKAYESEQEQRFQ